jgi:hypothetical protein
MTAVQRLKALAGAADVETARRKLLSDVQRSLTMTQPAVTKGDGHAKTYQASLMSIKTRAATCTTEHQIDELRNELLTMQKLRKQWLSAPKGPERPLFE